jgi:HSP20 family molecular chaperone IbpA
MSIKHVPNLAAGSSVAGKILAWAQAKEGQKTVVDKLAFLVGLRHGLRTLLGRLLGNWTSDLGPDVEIQDQRERVIVRLRADGFDGGSFDVNRQDRLLVVRAFKQIEIKGKKRGVDEMSFRELYRCAPIASSVDPALAETNYCNGVLTVSLPKIDLVAGLTSSNRAHAEGRSKCLNGHSRRFGRRRPFFDRRTGRTKIRGKGRLSPFAHQASQKRSRRFSNGL